jgi:hypothetical protein
VAVTPAELAALRGRLEAFAEDAFETSPRKDQAPAMSATRSD